MPPAIGGLACAIAAQTAAISAAKAPIVSSWAPAPGPTVIRGASTITQQLAKLVYTGDERDAMRKLREWLYAVEMERTLGKGRILQRFWGDTVHIDDGARMTWMRQPHYYMGLYPYTYSVGLVASTAMAQRVELEGAPAVAQWLEVLKAGGTQSPMELLQSAGIDLSTPEPIQAAVSWVGSLIAELEDSFNA